MHMYTPYDGLFLQHFVTSVSTHETLLALGKTLPTVHPLLMHVACCALPKNETMCLLHSTFAAAGNSLERSEVKLATDDAVILTDPECMYGRSLRVARSSWPPVQLSSHSRYLHQ